MKILLSYKILWKCYSFYSGVFGSVEVKTIDATLETIPIAAALFLERNRPAEGRMVKSLNLFDRWSSDVDPLVIVSM